jgi:tetratricopeptide (TPR) repeat protein
MVPTEDVSLRAGLLHRLGMALCKLGAREQAIRLYRKSLTLRRQAADTSGLALTLGNLGIGLCAQGEYAQAQQYLQESLRYYERLGDRNGYLHALVNLCHIALALEDPSLTQDYLAVALSSTWVECEMWLIAELFDCLARMALLQRRPLQAAQLFGWTATLKDVRSDQLPDLRASVRCARMCATVVSLLPVRAGLGWAAAGDAFPLLVGHGMPICQRRRCM